ncbi:MAG: alanine racemase [Myxococcota bacterium]|nr:alanine racemase [Myxococcota bacterium]
MSKLPYERPTVVKHTSGLANKFGRGSSRRTVPRIDGVAVSSLIEQYGSPLFVFSEHTLRMRYREVHRAFSMRYPKVQLAWSYKTNYLDAICRIYHQEGSFAEVVSEMEYEMARRLGVPGERILFNGPYKPSDALRRAFEEGAKVHLDHYDELYEAERIARSLGRKVAVAIRVNMDTGIYPRWDRFGFNFDSGEALDAARRIAASEHLVLTGLHCHIGTFILEPEAYRKAATNLATLARELHKDSGTTLDYVDLGGGFASRATLHEQYAPGTDSTPPIDEYAEAITSALLAASWPGGKMPTLYLETGRALVDEAGFLVTRVVGNKRLPGGARALVVDAGVSALFTSFWYRHDVLPVEDRGGMLEETVVYGPLCMNIDVVRPSVLLPPLEPGDALVVRPVGAYNVTQWMQFIRYRPPVLLVGEDGQTDVIRRGERIEDIKGPEELPARLKAEQ